MKYEDISDLYEAGEITMNEAIKLRIAYWNGTSKAMGEIERLNHKKQILENSNVLFTIYLLY